LVDENHLDVDRIAGEHRTTASTTLARPRGRIHVDTLIAERKVNPSSVLERQHLVRPHRTFATPSWLVAGAQRVLDRRFDEC